MKRKNKVQPKIDRLTGRHYTVLFWFFRSNCRR